MKKLFGIFLIFVCGTLVLPLNYTFAQYQDETSLGDNATVSVSSGDDEIDEEPQGIKGEDPTPMADKVTLQVTPAGEDNLDTFATDVKSIYKQQRHETIQIIKDCRDRLNSGPNQRSDIMKQCREQLDELKEQYKEVRKSIRDAIISFKDAYKTSIRDAAANQPDISGSENDEMKEKVRNAQAKIRQFQSDRG